MSGFIQRMLAEEFISKLCSKSMLITCCIILALTTGCTESLKNSTSDSSLAALGGKAHTFVDLPGYFVEFFTDYNLAGNTDSFCSGVHIGDGYVLTAAHCLDSLLTCATDLNHVFINTIVSSPSGRREQKLALAEVDGIALHAGWTPTEDYLHMGTGDDIALIKTDLAIAEQAELPGYPLDIKHSRFSGGELWTYGIGGSFEHQSHHEWSRSRASYFGGVVSADRSHTPLELSLDQQEQWIRQAETHPLLTEQGRAYLRHIKQSRVSATTTTSDTSSPHSLLSDTDFPDVTSESKISTVSKRLVVASSYYFGDMSITPPANQKPNITIYPTKSDHPHAIDLICHGDSGGPLIFRAGGNNSTNQDILLGLISATQYTAMDIHSVKDLVLQFNYAGEMSKNVGGTLYIEEDMFKFNCKNLTTTEQQILRDRKFYANWVTANVWYYRPWIDAAKQSLTLGHHSPSSACSSQEKASVILDR